MRCMRKQKSEKRRERCRLKMRNKKKKERKKKKKKKKTKKKKKKKKKKGGDEVDIEHGHFILNIVMKRFWIWWLMWRFDEMKWILNMAILFWILWWKDFEYDDWCEDLMRWSGYWTWPFYFEYCDEKILNMMIDVKIWWDEVDIEHGHFILNIVMKRFWIWWWRCRFDEMRWILNMAILFLNIVMEYVEYDS